MDLATIDPIEENSLTQLKKKPGGTHSKLAERSWQIDIGAAIDQCEVAFEIDVSLFIDNLYENLTNRTRDKSIVKQLGILNLSSIGPVSAYGKTDG